MPAQIYFIVPQLRPKEKRRGTVFLHKNREKRGSRRAGRTAILAKNGAGISGALSIDKNRPRRYNFLKYFEESHGSLREGHLKAFPWRGRWHPASPASRMTDEVSASPLVTGRSKAAGSTSSFTASWGIGRDSFPSRGSQTAFGGPPPFSKGSLSGISCK